MYNRQLCTFLKVAELESFSKAGECLYISASAVIQQINALERMNLDLSKRIVFFNRYEFQHMISSLDRS